MEQINPMFDIELNNANKEYLRQLKDIERVANDNIAILKKRRQELESELFKLDAELSMRYAIQYVMQDTISAADKALTNAGEQTYKLREQYEIQMSQLAKADNKDNEESDRTGMERPMEGESEYDLTTMSPEQLRAKLNYSHPVPPVGSDPGTYKAGPRDRY